MGKFVDCPFCGERGLRTKEHVWAQWLHDSPGALELLTGTHGERRTNTVRQTRRDELGRYEVTAANVGAVARWLPNVTVPVCGGCNSGWMSRLEEHVRDILRPFYETGRHVSLTADDLRELATWATKCWMAYALTLSAEQNPFTQDEYRAMAAQPAPLTRSRVWLLHSSEDVAQVSISLTTTLFAPAGPEQTAPSLDSTADNTAFGYLAAASVVLFMALVPDADVEAMDEMMEKVMTPPAAIAPGVRCVWPTARPQFFPLTETPPAAVRSLINYPHRLFSTLSLPVDGVTPAEADDALRLFLAGADVGEVQGPLP